MSETKWTKGPWNTHRHSSTAVQADSIGNVIANCGSWWDTRRDSAELIAEQIANAHLIAAAPEMYEALAMLLDAFEGDSDYLFTQGRKLGAVALAKARGEQ